MMNDGEIIEWLLEGDVSIQYQVHRDLLDKYRPDLQKRIGTEGWGARILSLRNPKGHWGASFYFPKWTSSHYTLMDLRNLCITPKTPAAKETIQNIIARYKIADGGVHPTLSAKHSDVCLNGMFLNFASYFGIAEAPLHSIIDFILTQRLTDGGFNCMLNRSGARHSSLHSTLSLLEGITEYFKAGHTYRILELENALQTSKEFILMHQLYISDRTGKVINPAFLKFPFSRRWRYDILSALDYFQYSDTPWDSRMQPAIDVVFEKRNKDGTWNANAKYDGQIHFEMEKAGRPSRWNTLRVLRIMNHLDIDLQDHNM